MELSEAESLWNSLPDRERVEIFRKIEPKASTLDRNKPRSAFDGFYRKTQFAIADYFENSSQNSLSLDGRG